MPSLIVETNVSSLSIPDGLNSELTDIMEQCLGKSGEYIAVLVRGDQRLTFGRTSEPAAICHVICVGKIGLEENKVTTEKILKKLTEALNIAPDRMYIHFEDFARANVGWNNITFG